MSSHFSRFRKGVVGIDASFESPYGTMPLVYADWVASGRMYGPIEERIQQDILPFVANTHTETSHTGTLMTKAYHEAHRIVKKHVNADSGDALIMCGSGMTGVVNKFQRMLGLKISEQFRDQLKIPEKERPIVFCTHMEHHSNQTTWLETIADVRVIEPCEKGLVNLAHFAELLEEFKERKFKIAAVTCCSNVTGIHSPYPQIASMIHAYGGYCFVDFACSAPYVDIDMHPADVNQKLDAVMFSPHKFLGGPGTPGVLVFNRSLYHCSVPDQPGGGTVKWTNPWGGHSYFEDVETREDGGTPPFLQTIRTAMVIKLKEEMGTLAIAEREEHLKNLIWDNLLAIPGLNMLADNISDRLPIFSFYIEGLHFNLGVKLLNDRFGIQTRGGCACAGTYGHYLLGVDESHSCSITDAIDHGDLTAKPGWIRFSLHPVMTDDEALYILDSIRELAMRHKRWALDYEYQPHNNEFLHKTWKESEKQEARVKSWFSVTREEKELSRKFDLY
jgi:selenocysteine lyase/cysteine desulfurase